MDRSPMPEPFETTQSAGSPPGSAPHISGGRHEHRWLILGVVGTAQLMVVLDATIVNIALPSAQQDLGFSDGNRQWVVTAYALAFGSLLLLGGRIADLVGRKVVFLAGLAGFALASALGGAATSFTMLVVARALQGVFGALLAPAALSLLTTTFTDPKERAKAFGVYGAIAGAGGAVGLLLGGVLTEYLDWRWCLYVNLIFAAVAMLGGARLLHGGRPADRPKLDVPGTLLVSAGLFCIVYGFSNAETHAWSDVDTWGFLVVGAVLVAAFAWWQTRAEHPLLPLRVVLDRDRGASFLAMFISGSRHVRRVPVPDVLPPADPRLHPRQDRSRVPADGRRDGGGLRRHDQLARAAVRRQTDRAARHGSRGGLDGLVHRPRREQRIRRTRPSAAARRRSRPGPGLRPRDEHGDRRCRRARRGCRVGDGQHQPAGGRFDRHGPAQLARHQRRGQLPRGQGPDASGGGPGGDGELLDRVLVVGSLLRRRPRRYGRALPPWSPVHSEASGGAVHM